MRFTARDPRQHKDHLSKLLRSLALVCAGLLTGCAAHALEINEASEAQLDSIKGLGPQGTARILQARQAGAFNSWADFMSRVKGIKPATATKFSAQGVTVNGMPYAEKGR